MQPVFGRRPNTQEISKLIDLLLPSHWILLTQAVLDLKGWWGGILLMPTQPQALHQPDGWYSEWPDYPYKLYLKTHWELPDNIEASVQNHTPKYNTADLIQNCLEMVMVWFPKRVQHTPAMPLQALTTIPLAMSNSNLGRSGMYEDDIAATDNSYKILYL